MKLAVRSGRFRVKEGEKVNLEAWPPDDTSGFPGTEKDALEESKRLTGKLEKLQEKLYAEHKRKVLVVLQAVDTGGKDGTIKKVFEGVNPQGVRVSHFGVPTAEEGDHDFLWRVHKETPESGGMVIFNRSHYEDVLVARVHNLVDRKVLERRYKDIAHFEGMLNDDDTVIMKFFLNISREEQKKRLLERLADPSKQWKFSSSDTREREFWPKYMKAYQEALEWTSTERAPWYIVPSNKKWFRDLVVSSIIVETLESLGMKYPNPVLDPASMKL